MTDKPDKPSVGVYKIPNITSALLQGILEILRTNRKIAVTIRNHSSQTLEEPKIYIAKGTSQYGIPFSPVSSGEGLVWGARKTEYALRGTAGVIVYHIKYHDLYLAFYWSLPFAYGSHSNWWNIKVYKGLTKPDKDLFEEMKDGRHKGNSNPCEGEGESGSLSWSYTGSMGGAGQCTVEIDFQDRKA